MSDKIKISKYSPQFYEQYFELYKEFEHIEAQQYHDRNPTDANVKRIVDSNIEDFSKNTSTIFILTKGDALLGFTSGHKSEDLENRHPSFYIEDIFVTGTERGKGYGTLLIKKAEEYAKELGLTKLSLTVLSNNPGAYKLYIREGFKDYSITLVKDI